MIDTLTETAIPLTQAAVELPRRRGGRKTHVSTLYRWATGGCRGVVLETINVGATRCTSREAMQRFFEQLSAPNAAGQADRTTPPPVHRSARSVAQRERDAVKAGQKLAARGA